MLIGILLGAYQELNRSLSGVLTGSLPAAFFRLPGLLYRLPVVVILSLPGVSSNLLGVCLLDTEKPKLLP